MGLIKRNIFKNADTKYGAGGGIELNEHLIDN